MDTNKKNILTIAVIIIVLAAFLIIIVINKSVLDKSASTNSIIPLEDIVAPIEINEQQVKNLIAKECGDLLDHDNVYMTECAIELLDRVAAEREWKQRKLETAKHPQINIYNLAPVLENEQLKIRNWRDNFEKMRNIWCDARWVFISNSGTPWAIAECRLGLELVAINILDNFYYEIIMKELPYSQGIPNFEPTGADIDALTKVNKTKRGCIWAGEETDCD